MDPTWEQIKHAAYERWERRGGLHGHDAEDWLGAERDLVFGLNYAVLARHRLNGPDVEGPTDRVRRCRFCERSEAEGAELVPHPVVPEVFTTSRLLTGAECDECLGASREGLDAGLEALLQRILTIRQRADLGRGYGERCGPSDLELTATALKSLTRVALLLMPERELAGFPDALEWVANPQHGQDRGVLEGLAGYVYLPHVPFASSWVSLVRRTDDDAPFPYMMLFLATPELVLQVPVPFSVRDDDDRDGERIVMPRLSMACGHGHDFRDSLCVVATVEAGGSRSRGGGPTERGRGLGDRLSATANGTG